MRSPIVPRKGAGEPVNQLPKIHGNSQRWPLFPLKKSKITGPSAIFTQGFATWGLSIEIHQSAILVPALQSQWLVMHIVTWVVAAFLIIINGYLLVDFFSKEIHGLLSGSILCAGLAVYVAFVFYLIMRGCSSAVFKKFSSVSN